MVNKNFNNINEVLLDSNRQEQSAQGKGIGCKPKAPNRYCNSSGWLVMDKGAAINRKTFS